MTASAYTCRMQPTEVADSCNAFGHKLEKIRVVGTHWSIQMDRKDMDYDAGVIVLFLRPVTLS